MKGIGIFVTGTTGYIGGSIAARLVAAAHVVTGLVRDGHHAATLAAAGVKPVVGTLDDTALLHAFACDALTCACSQVGPPASYPPIRTIFAANY
ncbi:NmrA family NAD(P)-binding protein [Burkholderia sola]|uniref:NmrA family NAD(P)-binding protein n=1 Tax=Burkholderia sola TaxID=2843302 RepID=UPI00338E6E06